MNQFSNVLRSASLFCALVLPSLAEVTSPGDGPIVLFNGTNLNGWYTWLVDSRYDDPRHVFTVTNQTLHISGDGLGYLATTNNYEDFRLVAEFRWGKRNSSWGDRIGKARDSGIFLHSIGPDGSSHDGNGAFRPGIECQIFQGATGDFLLIRGSDAAGALIAPRISAEIAPKRDGEGWPYWRKGGAITNIVRWGRLNWFGKDPNWKDVLDFRSATDIERAPGEWNRIECICEAASISVRLNGVLVNEAFDVYPRRGKILLQCEGSEIFFRNLELYPLKRAQQDAPAK